MHRLCARLSIATCWLQAWISCTVQHIDFGYWWQHYLWCQRDGESRSRQYAFFFTRWLTLCCFLSLSFHSLSLRSFSIRENCEQVSVDCWEWIPSSLNMAWRTCCRSNSTTPTRAVLDPTRACTALKLARFASTNSWCCRACTHWWLVITINSPPSSRRSIRTGTMRRCSKRRVELTLRSSSISHTTNSCRSFWAKRWWQSSACWHRRKATGTATTRTSIQPLLTHLLLPLSVLVTHSSPPLSSDGQKLTSSSPRSDSPTWFDDHLIFIVLAWWMNTWWGWWIKLHRLSTTRSHKRWPIICSRRRANASVWISCRSTCSVDVSLACLASWSSANSAVWNLTSTLKSFSARCPTRRFVVLR